MTLGAEPRRVESYAMGRWMVGGDEGVVVADAVTGDPLVRVSSTGLDLAGMVAHARTVGGPALRELTFHERAAMLKTLALHLNEQRDELYELWLRAGDTRRGAMVDIDGGIGVLFSYSSRGRRELPSGRVVLDGEAEPLGKAGTFLGQHLYVPRRGVAVQINAFNFPVWGMLEKLAPAFLAGLPTIVKAATPTGYIAEAAVRHMLNLLPEGSLQLVSGSADGLLDLLDGQDSVAFTGSASTARRLRAHRSMLEHAVRFNAEQDSLNAAILGPDAAPGSPEFDLFVKSLVTEMTVKAGQRCTAIRRAFVPSERMNEVTDAVAARLSRVVVGDPRDESVTMGALAAREQREEVRRSVEALRAPVVVGDMGDFPVLGADPDRGAFLPPLLLRADDPDRPEPHTVEAFGPVSTLLPYRDADHVVALAARGSGSLVASVVSYDRGFVRDVVLGLGAHHGRILVLDRDDAKEQTGHGAALATLVHGGPGRAGGGEELGGIRAVLHQMQRVALQGSPDALAAVTGSWVPGAAVDDGPPHPFRKHLEELRIGDRIVAGPRTVTDADVAQFAAFTGDTFYAHTDDEAAAANPFFGRRVAHGYLVLAFAAGLFVDPAPGPVLANYGVDGLRFLAPVFPGDEMTVALTCKQITPRPNTDYGEVRWDAVITNGEGTVVATYDVLTLVASQE
ncbi:MAG: phenylacetic acid degradation bifunctional protein PaaZ [Chloroflexota bacterium]